MFIVQWLSSFTDYTDGITNYLILHVLFVQTVWLRRGDQRIKKQKTTNGCSKNRWFITVCLFTAGIRGYRNRFPRDASVDLARARASGRGQLSAAAAADSSHHNDFGFRHIIRYISRIITTARTTWK